MTVYNTVKPAELLETGYKCEKQVVGKGLDNDGNIVQTYYNTELWKTVCVGGLLHDVKIQSWSGEQSDQCNSLMRAIKAGSISPQPCTSGVSENRLPTDGTELETLERTILKKS